MGPERTNGVTGGQSRGVALVAYYRALFEADFAAQEAAKTEKTDAKQVDQKRELPRQTAMVQVQVFSAAVAVVDSRGRAGARLIDVPIAPSELGLPEQKKSKSSSKGPDRSEASQTATGRESVEATPHRAIPETPIGRGRQQGRSQHGAHVERGPNPRFKEMRARIGMSIVAIRQAQKAESFEGFAAVVIT